MPPPGSVKFSGEPRQRSPERGGPTGTMEKGITSGVRLGVKVAFVLFSGEES
jgi:hypothetical protein